MLKSHRDDGCRERSVYRALRLLLDQSQWIYQSLRRSGWNICASYGGKTAAEMSKLGLTREYWQISCKSRDFFIRWVLGHIHHHAGCPERSACSSLRGSVRLSWPQGWVLQGPRVPWHWGTSPCRGLPAASPETKASYQETCIYYFAPAGQGNLINA